MTFDKFPDGAPCWFELATTDIEGGISFWTALMGWKPDRFAGPDGHPYVMFAKDEAHVGACFSMDAAMRKQGVPSHWGVYFSVADCDAATKRAEKAGGKVLAGPFDVDVHGRMSMIADPEGATFGLWQGKQMAGAGRMLENGAVNRVELAVRDGAKAETFYRAVLGWHVEHMQHPMAGLYRNFDAGGRRWGGILQMTKEWGDLPAHWSLYWQVADADATAAQAKKLGGDMGHGNFDAPGVGRLGRISDPQGAGAYIITPKG